MSADGSFAKAAAALLALGCTPDLASDPVPEAMEFDTEATPARVPSPTGLILDPTTGRLNFGLAGAPLPEDCAAASPLSEAECLFNRYLETLDGFPTVTVATAPATDALDPSTLTLGENVVVLAQDGGEAPSLEAGFDETQSQLTLRPTPSWTIGATYWVAVRGYANGARARSGADVVGSPTMTLLKQDTPLPCGAETPDELDSACPALQLLSQNLPPADAAESLFTLEAIRSSYQASGVWESLASAGLPKNEIAVLWGFPIHTAPVVELDPTAGLLPRPTAPNELRLPVQGALDGDSVSGFAVRERPGSVVLMDLTAAAAGDLVSGFPPIEARYTGGEIVITGETDFVEGHDYGVFVTRAVKGHNGQELAPAPITVLLTSPAPLIDDAGNSLVSAVSDADAALLDAGRRELAVLFENPVFTPLTGVARTELVYCFAFPFQVSP